MSEALEATQDALATIAPFAALSPATRVNVVVSGRLRAYVHSVGYRHAVEVLEHNPPSAVVSSPVQHLWGDTS